MSQSDPSGAHPAITDAALPHTDPGRFACGCHEFRSATRSYGTMALVTRQFHIEDRARGRIVATGEIDASDLVIWDETETIVREELSDLAEQIQRDIAAGYSGGQLRPPLEWFEL